ncbi:hypothetical protein G6F46_002327 [Rhizopus delemar]|uniref:Uncharacterized protein n=2 Tax=Rhizopus TaxID=4842 RepID=A0A9P6Z848_9FUNG|nr:hypothetical protein G6F43_004447 [Rhizopus delemar]KAG1545644.1 hypothetical protein G6F51_005342 [Rhizopus arrhizus]KAG1463272.1 hypothetical protein G6F55_002490 [Rhizopus delemar]KAG1499247.1 hypothetical protein G6F54_004534 [Rhizopus delemar]KAG1507740.1 hypothetical protein G6F52_011561 [Rhizopus delemar]
MGADEYEEGNDSTALNIYLTGIDMIIMALPNKTINKGAIHKKLLSVEERIGMSMVDKVRMKQKEEIKEDWLSWFKETGECVIHWSVRLAFAIKQSPLPNIIIFVFSCLFQSMFWIDRQYRIVERAQHFIIVCIKLGLELNQQYRLHEFISESLFIIMTAMLKAIIAYKEA